MHTCMLIHNHTCTQRNTHIHTHGHPCTCLHAHRCILAPMFRRKSGHCWTSNIKNISITTFQIYLQFASLGCLDITEIILFCSASPQIGSTNLTQWNNNNNNNNSTADSKREHGIGRKKMDFRENWINWECGSDSNTLKTYIFQIFKE